MDRGTEYWQALDFSNRSCSSMENSEATSEHTFSTMFRLYLVSPLICCFSFVFIVVVFNRGFYYHFNLASVVFVLIGIGIHCPKPLENIGIFGDDKGFTIYDNFLSFFEF